jgi:hypothetical protein
MGSFNRFFLFLLFFSILRISFSQNAVPNYVPTNGLVGWWPFNGNANDESGNGITMDMFNSNFSNDRYQNLNSSILLQGNNNSFLEVSPYSVLNINEFTWSIWVKFNSNTYAGGGYDLNPAIASRTQYGSTCDGVTIFEADSKAGAQNLICNNTFENLGCGSSTVIGDDNWHHLVFILSPSGNYSQFFIDGEPQNSSYLPNYFTVPFDQPIRFGRPTDFYWRAFQGNMDDIGIWNRALTPCEIFQLYSGQLASSNSPVNAGSTINLTASSFTDATYSWTGPDGFTSTSQNPSRINATNAMSGDYIVTVNYGGCEAKDTVSMVINTPLTIEITSIQASSPSCGDLTVTADFITTGFYPANNYFTMLP